MFGRRGVFCFGEDREKGAALLQDVLRLLDECSAGCQDLVHHLLQGVP